jgi:aspartate/methionine/tyrosine aminotransferase
VSVPISSRVAAIAESATLAVDARAKALKAAGEDVVVFGAGEPDFPTPDHVVEAAAKACAEPRNHHYTPTGGLPELRAAVAEKTKRDSGYDVRPSQVLVTNGGKQAIFEVFATLIDDGDEVLLPAPYWTTYPEPVAYAGGRTVVVPTDVTSGYKVTVEQLEAAVTERTRALVFVSPSNPTGAVYSPEQVEAIGRWAADRGIWVVTDEIYEHLTYDGREAPSMPVLVPELADRCVVVNGVAKTFAMTGWRVGWMIGPDEVVAAATRLQSHLTSNVANVSQVAALAAIEGGLDDFVRMREAFDRRRRVLHAGLAAIPGVECPLPEGAFYAFPSFEDLLGRTIAGREVTTTMDLAAVLLEEAKVAVVPGEAFGAPGHARLSFALADDALSEGVTRLQRALAPV